MPIVRSVGSLHVTGSHLNDYLVHKSHLTTYSVPRLKQKARWRLSQAFTLLISFHATLSNSCFGSHPRRKKMHSVPSLFPQVRIVNNLKISSCVSRK